MVRDSTCLEENGPTNSGGEDYIFTILKNRGDQERQRERERARARTICSEPGLDGLEEAVLGHLWHHDQIVRLLQRNPTIGEEVYHLRRAIPHQICRCFYPNRMCRALPWRPTLRPVYLGRGSKMPHVSYLHEPHKRRRVRFLRAYFEQSELLSTTSPTTQGCPFLISPLFGRDDSTTR